MSARFSDQFDWSYKNDQTFRDAINADRKNMDDALIDWNATYGSGFMEDEPYRYDPQTFNVDIVERHKKMFIQFRGARASGAIEDINLGMDNAVQQMSQLVTDTPVDVRLRTMLEFWDGDVGSPAYVFKTEYLDNLRAGLHELHDVVVAMQKIMAAHWGIVITARSHILQIAQQTIEATDSSVQAHNRSQAESLATIVGTAISATAAAATAPAGGAGGAAAWEILKGVGVIATRPRVAEGGIDEVIESMESNVRELVTNIEGEECELLSALEYLRFFIDRNKERLLPPDINTPSPRRPTGPI